MQNTVDLGKHPGPAGNLNTTFVSEMDKWIIRQFGNRIRFNKEQ